MTRWLLGAMIVLTGVSGLEAGAPVLLFQDPVRHEVTVTGREHRFFPARIEVAAGDILKITLVAEDVPCSFAIDAYRISKRATPEHPVVFEFRADRAGTYAYYCDLTADDGCLDMRGELVVDGR